MTAYQGANDGSSDGTSDWLVAGRLDFGGGFRLSVAHKRTTNDNESTQGQLTDAGVKYAQGANSFSLVGSVGEMDESGATYSAITGSYARALGPGVKVHMNLIWKRIGRRRGIRETAVSRQSLASRWCSSVQRCFPGPGDRRRTLLRRAARAALLLSAARKRGPGQGGARRGDARHGMARQGTYS